jgi:hypothetical protein
MHARDFGFALQFSAANTAIQHRIWHWMSVSGGNKEALTNFT